MDDEIITTEELAGYLKVGERTIDRLRKEGLPFIKVRGAIRFEKQKALKWIEKQNK